MSDRSPVNRKGALAWMVRHSVAANLIMLTCLIGGFLFTRHIKQEVFPDFSIDQVMVTVVYPGASPEDVEKGIVLAIENAVTGLEGVDEVQSMSRENVGTVIIDAMRNADIQKLADDVKREIDRITTFPLDAEEPQVTIPSIHRSGIMAVVYGDASESALHEIAEDFRDELLQDPGITQVVLQGVKPLEIRVEVPRENLTRYHTTLDAIARAIRDASVDLPGGSIKTESNEILIRVKERMDYGREFARIPVITSQTGGRVLLSDIARITDGYEDVDYCARFDGKPAIMLDVKSVGDQTPVQVSRIVRKHIAAMNERLPQGVRTDILYDSSEIYAQRVNLLLKNSAMGLVLVLVILSIFLEFRLAFWVMLGIPISFLGAFLFLPGMGVSLNMISLFAFIISLGIVVDDAIVVGENVYYHRQRGLSMMDAAIQGVRDMVMPVTFSVLTNVVTFIPLYFVPGVSGKIFGVIPLVVCTVFLISLGESLFVLPSHLGHQNSVSSERAGRLHRMQQRFSKGFERWVEFRYGAFLHRVLKHRVLTVVVALSVLILMASYAMSGRMGLTAFPKVESDFSQCMLEMPVGVSFSKTEQKTRRIVDAARRIAEETGHADELVEGIFADIGSNGGNRSKVIVFMAAPEIRDKILSTKEFTRRWREAVGDIDGIKSIRFESDAGGPGSGRALTVELSHRNLNVLKNASHDLAEALKGFPIVKDIEDGFTPGKEQLNFKVLPKGRFLGLTPRSVARQLRDAFYGVEVVRQQRGRNELKVKVKLPESQRISENDIGKMMLKTPKGKEVPFLEVASLQRGRAYFEINRRNGRRVIQVQADVTPRKRAGEVVNSLKKTILPALKNTYPGLDYRFEGKQADIVKDLGSLKVSFSLAILVIFAMLAIPFQSYLQPLIVMVSIPFGIIGAIVGHLVLGYSLSIISMLGIVALSGVVVNDSLVLISYINELRKAGKDKFSAVHTAAIQRFRPILLTTLTTFGGLMPMMMETSLQARFLIPMAISLAFGVLFATGITLILVPALYLIVSR